MCTLFIFFLIFAQNRYMAQQEMANRIDTVGLKILPYRVI